MRHIKGVNRSEIILQVDNMVNENSEIYFIDKFIEYLILNDPDKYNRKTKSLGRISFDNKIYLKIYLYSYLNGIRGSRSIEKECKRNIELIWLLENLHPNYWSINNYRKNHKEEIKSMTLEFRKYLKEFDYITDELIAYDGSKIKADADKRTYSLKKLEKKLSKIKETITTYIENSENIDNYDDLLLEYQKDKEAFELKYSKLEGENLELKDRISSLLLKEKNLNTDKKIIESYILKKRPEERRTEKISNKEKKISYCINDLDSRVMKTRDGLKMCYNLQTGVSDKYKMFTYASVTQEQNDKTRLAENIKEQSQEIDLEAKKLVADTGYFSISEIKEVESRGISCYIPIPKTNKPVYNYDETDDTYLCSENKKFININKKRISGNREYNIYLCKDCKNCLSKKKCNLKKSTKTKEIWIDTNKEEIDDFKEKMKSKEAKKIIKCRKGIVEHPYGTIKRWFGKLGFIVTGLESVQTEIDLVTTAYNIKRLLNVEKNKEVLLKQLEVYFNIEKIMI